MKGCILVDVIGLGVTSDLSNLTKYDVWVNFSPNADKLELRQP
jgi:hypothetical protein